MTRPLEGLKVLDFTHVLAGPFGTRVLADMGADVIKINSASRAVGANEPVHPYYIMWNRNKRALALDMTNEHDRELCRRLCQQAEVVIDNFSVGVLERWGVGYDEVVSDNPGVIYVQMSGMGEGGPWSGYVTYAPTIHALSGLTYLTGVPGREDIGIGYSYNDHQAGLHGAVAILAALEARQHSGRGQHIDISQFEIGVNFAGPSVFDLFANDRAADPVGYRLPYDEAAPHGCYPCRPSGEGITGECWIAIACMDDDAWEALKRVMGIPEWSERDAYTTVGGRLAEIDEIDRAIAEFTASEDAYELMVRCQAAGVPAGVVQDGHDLANNDPQLRHYDFLHRIDDDSSEFGQTWADRLPLRFSRTPCNTYHRVRAVGEDNVSVLKDWLDMSESEVRSLEDEGRLR